MNTELALNEKQTQPMRSFVPFTDNEALKWLTEKAGKSEAEARQIVEGCRRGAIEEGIPEIPCHFFVRFSAIIVEMFEALCDPRPSLIIDLDVWGLLEESTVNCLISGVPKLLDWTRAGNMESQLQNLKRAETQWNVPQGFFSQRLLSAFHIAGVISASGLLLGRTSWLRTGTRSSIPDKRHINLSINRKGRVIWDHQSQGRSGMYSLGVCALGITPCHTEVKPTRVV